MDVLGRPDEAFFLVVHGLHSLLIIRLLLAAAAAQGHNNQNEEQTAQSDQDPGPQRQECATVRSDYERVFTLGQLSVTQVDVAESVLAQEQLSLLEGLGARVQILEGAEELLIEHGADHNTVIGIAQVTDHQLARVRAFIIRKSDKRHLNVVGSVACELNLKDEVVQ